MRFGLVQIALRQRVRRRAGSGQARSPVARRPRVAGRRGIGVVLRGHGDACAQQQRDRRIGRELRERLKLPRAASMSPAASSDSVERRQQCWPAVGPAGLACIEGELQRARARREYVPAPRGSRRCAEQTETAAGRVRGHGIEQLQWLRRRCRCMRRGRAPGRHSARAGGCVVPDWPPRKPPRRHPR